MSYTILAIQNFTEHRMFIPAPPSYEANSNEDESAQNEQISIRDELAELLSPMRMKSARLMADVNEQRLLNAEILSHREEVQDGINTTLQRLDSTEKLYEKFENLFTSHPLLLKQKEAAKQSEKRLSRNLRVPLTHRPKADRELSQRASTHRVAWKF